MLHMINRTAGQLVVCLEPSSLDDSDGRRGGGLIVAGVAVLGKLLRPHGGVHHGVGGKHVARAGVWAVAATAWG